MVISGIGRVGSGIIASKSGIASHWGRDQQFSEGSGIRDQGSGCAIFVRSETKIGQAFGIKDKKFGYQNGISDEKPISLRPCYH